MTKLARSVVVAAVLGAAAMASFDCAAQGPARAVANLRDVSYDGAWTGKVKCLYDPGIWPDDDCDIGLRLDIAGKLLHVHQAVRSKAGKETVSDINPGKFSFSTLGPNAIAVSMDSGRDEDGTWVETWSFAMTLKDADHMIVHWTRIVNNVDVPLGTRGSKFSSVGMGELVRAK